MIWNFRCYLASRGNADSFAIRIAGLTADDGDDVASIDAHQGLEHRRAGRLQRLYLDDHLDRRFPHNKYARAQIQAWINAPRRPEFMRRI